MRTRVYPLEFHSKYSENLLLLCKIHSVSDWVLQTEFLSVSLCTLVKVIQNNLLNFCSFRFVPEICKK